MPDTSGYHVDDFLILPGQWRPQCPWEHIAWISPPWPSRYYLWLDLPETVFDQKDGQTRNHFLSHINNQFPALYPGLPPAPWKVTADGLSVSRTLPSGLAFTSSLKKAGESVIALELILRNGGSDTLHDLRIQTCTYMRAIAEFSDFSLENKYVFVNESRWENMEGEKNQIDYRSGEVQLPVVATVSSEAERLAAMTWYDDTGKLWANRKHPCMHADPCFPDLEPGETAHLKGELIFFQGDLDSFYGWFSRRWEEKRRT